MIFGEKNEITYKYHVQNFIIKIHLSSLFHEFRIAGKS